MALNGKPIADDYNVQAVTTWRLRELLEKEKELDAIKAQELKACQTCGGTGWVRSSQAR